MKKVCVKYQPIIPLLYDESLSYYETVAKLAHKVNEMIDAYNSVVGPINNIQTTVNEANTAVQEANTALNSANTALARSLALEDDIELAVTGVTALNALPHIVTSVNTNTTHTITGIGSFTIHWRVDTYSNNVVEVVGYANAELTLPEEMGGVDLGKIALPGPVATKLCEVINISAGSTETQKYNLYKKDTTTPGYTSDLQVFANFTTDVAKFRLDIYVKGLNV